MIIVYASTHGLTVAILSSSSGNAGNAAESREGEPGMGGVPKDTRHRVVNNLIIVIGYHYVLLLY